SGKSTFLALVRLAWDLCQGSSPLDLNEEPFLLGAYDQIASSRRGPGGRSQQFCIGAEVISKGPKRRRRSAVRFTDSITVKGRFVRKEGQPHLQDLVLEAAPFRIEILYEEREKPPRLTLQSPSGSMGIAAFPMLPQPWPLPIFFNYLRYWRSRSRKVVPQEAPSIEGDILSSTDLEALEELTFALHRGLDQRPYAFAPVRTRPKRTYDPFKDIPDPEGSHVPMILAKAFTSEPTASAQLREAIDAFGRASGLFTDIDIRRIGRKEGDP